MTLFISGTFTGWISPVLQLLQKDETPLPSGPLTVSETSWITSLFFIGLIVMSPIYAQIIGYIGRKNAILLISVPPIIGWMILIFVNSVTSLTISRFFGGLAFGASFIANSIFVTEISDDGIRGAFGSAMLIFLYSGVLCGNIIGTTVPYHIAPYVMLVFPIIFLCTVPFIHETPVYLLKSKKVKKAERSLQFYKKCSKNSEKFRVEWEKVQIFLQQISGAKERLEMKDIFNVKSFKSLLIAITLGALFGSSGILVIMIYGTVIFRDSGSNIDANTSTTIMTLFQLIGCCLATVLCDLIGRKRLLIVSLLGCTLGQCSIGLFNYLSSKGYDVGPWSWSSIVSLSAVLFFASIGISPLRVLVGIEVLPLKIRSFGASCNVMTGSTVNLIFSIIYPILSAKFGIYVVMWSLSVINGLGVIFIVFVLEETAGKNVNK